MRNFRIVAVAYKQTTSENEKLVRASVGSLVMKIKSPEETVMHFSGNFDEEKVREKLEKVRTVCETKEQNLGVVVFDFFKYNPQKPQEYDCLFYEIAAVAKELDITFVVLLRYKKVIII